MTLTMYHRVIRTSLLVLALMLVFDSGILSPLSRELSKNAIQYVAQSVGVFAQIEPNEFNVITAELQKREQELANREATLRTIEARTFGGGSGDRSTYILSILVFILSVLVIVNYVLDWRRAHTRMVGV
jgi:hypothetical protein